MTDAPPPPQPPEEEWPWIERVQGLLRTLILPTLAFALGLWIVYQDAVSHPPADTTTSGIGVLLMGILPFSAIDIFGGRK